MAGSGTLAWSNIVAALGAAIVSTLVTAAYLKGFPAQPTGVAGALSGITTLVTETITYIPHILLLFGVLADMFTMEGVYSIPSLIGLFSIPVNYAMTYFWLGLGSIWASIVTLYTTTASSPISATPSATDTNPFRTANSTIARPPVEDTGAGTGLSRPRKLKMDGGSITDYNGCQIRGFESMSNPYAPQTLVVTATIFMYYIFDLVMNRGWVDATAPIVVFFVLYTAEVFVVGKCDDKAFPTAVTGLISYIHGLIFGGTAYGVVSSYYPQSLPSRVLPDFPRKTAADLTRREDGTYVDENNSPWVILPNGNAIPAMSTSVTGVAVDETSTSTGSAATPGSCPGGNC